VVRRTRARASIGDIGGRGTSTVAAASTVSMYRPCSWLTTTRLAVRERGFE
jgi:hypothetical protein